MTEWAEGVVRGSVKYMRKKNRTWQRQRLKAPPKPHADEELRASVLDQAEVVVATLKKRYCKTLSDPQFNWADDFFTRWHRDALYFVVLMRTPHGRPPTFETHAARMEHVGGGKFNLAIPMRRGWNTIKKDASPEECLKEISESICF